MKIWHKILVAPAVAALFMLALGALAVYMMARQGMAMAEIVRDRGGAMEVATGGSQHLGQVHARVYHLLITPDGIEDEGIRAVGGSVNTRLDAMAERLRQFVATSVLSEEERRLVQQIEPQLAGYRTDIGKAIELTLQDREGALRAMQEASIGFQALTRSYDDLVQVQKGLVESATAQGAVDFRNTVAAFIAIVLLAVLVACAISVWMGRSIARRLRHAIEVAGAIAGGDLTTQVPVHGRDETAELLQALEQMQRDLRRLVAEVAGGARTVADTSAQIAQGNLDLSQRTEEQASTLEETASSMEELTSTVTQNAENARLASQLAVGASDVARKGGQVVGEVVSTMTGISDASRKISDIIGVIDGIAFQTNILALNAAVEAARAGEQGRGFAVVAAEVRSLAQRSAAAAREIKGLIVDSVDQVEAGTRLVGSAGRTMDEIVDAVRKVSDLIAEIAAASREQSSGLEQVNAAVAQMDHVVQQNASLVEEASAAAESMKAQAGGLLQAVARFRLDDAPAPAEYTPLQPVAAAPPPTPVPPIRVQPSAAQLPPAAQAMLGTATADAGANGAWREF